jgi:hypothetical protein
MGGEIKTARFYQQWKGHPIDDLEAFLAAIQSKRQSKPIIYLAGDSSLDNKYWVPSSGRHGESLPVNVPEIYQHVLSRPEPKPDVAFWMNHFLGERGTALNLAVEESMLRDRDDSLLSHDEFIRDNICSQDILIVSVGANDIALRPSFCTIVHMLQLAWLTPRSSLERGTAWALPYFKRMFQTKVQTYVSRMIEKQKPRAVIVCMIYYPLEAKESKEKSWADLPLRLLGYNRNPGQLKAGIQAMYTLATKNIDIPGTKIIPCALFEVLDGTDAGHYVARVEPSSDGGCRMAEHFMKSLEAFLT